MFNPKLVTGFPGLYEADGSWWVRPLVDGKRTWRKLDALTLKTAVKESSSKIDAHERFLAGESKTSPFTQGTNTFSHIARLYLAAGCPHSKSRTARNDHFCNLEAKRIEWLNKYFGDKQPDDIKLPMLLAHAVWRKKFCRRGGERVVELEWVTLSNVLSYAVFHGLATFNHVRQQRPQLRVEEPGQTVASRIRHARDVAPASGDMVHQLARELLSGEESQSGGWLWLFACLTGLRRAELLALRLDAKPPMHPDGLGQPGYTDDRFLHVKRGKRSKRHKVLLYPELNELLEAHFHWHQANFPDNPWYFPGRNKGEPLDQGALSHRLPVVCERLGLPQLTMHGGRSYFTSVLRSKGMNDAEIASRIGDSTVELIQETYGSIPGNWEGGKPLSFLPSEGKPAWALDFPVAPRMPQLKMPQDDQKPEFAPDPIGARPMRRKRRMRRTNLNYIRLKRLQKAQNAETAPDSHPMPENVS